MSAAARLAGRPRAWLAAAYVGLVVLHIGLSAGMSGPFIGHDEYGYLANARYMAGTDAVPAHPFSPFYSPGYSLLLVPLYLLPPSPGAVHQGALVVNALAASALVLLAYPLARRLLGLSPGRAVLAAVVTAAYPAVLAKQRHRVEREPPGAPGGGMAAAGPARGRGGRGRPRRRPRRRWGAPSTRCIPGCCRWRRSPWGALGWLAWRRVLRPAAAAGVAALGAALGAGRLLGDRVYAAIYDHPGPSASTRPPTTSSPPSATRVSGARRF